MERTPRTWRQLHLPTCVVLMFIAGLLVWANLQARQTIESIDPRGRAQWVCWHAYGVPCCLFEGSHLINAPIDRTHIANRFHSPQPYPYINPEYVKLYCQDVFPEGEWRGPGLALNLSAAVAILAAVACGMEYVLRRRARTAAPPSV